MIDFLSGRLFTKSALSRVAGLALVGFLAGCVTNGIGPFETQVAQQKTTLANGDLTIVAPHGWCVDPKTLQNAQTGGFVLFGNCAAISGNPKDARAPAPALMSASVGAPMLADHQGHLSTARLKVIERFFRSDIGRAALARSGEARDVKIVSSEIVDGMLILRITDLSKGSDPPVAQTYLRAITSLGGRLAALSVMPLKDGEMPAEEQRRLLRAFAETIRRAN